MLRAGFEAQGLQAQAVRVGEAAQRLQRGALRAEHAVDERQRLAVDLVRAGEAQAPAVEGEAAQRLRSRCSWRLNSGASSFTRRASSSSAPSSPAVRFHSMRRTRLASSAAACGAGGGEMLHHARAHGGALADIERRVVLAIEEVHAGRLGHRVYRARSSCGGSAGCLRDLARGDRHHLLAVLALGDAQELPQRVGVAGGAVARAAFDVVARDQAVEVVVRLAGIQAARQAHRAQRLRRELEAGAVELAAQEAVVEARVVRDEDAPLQALEQLPGEVVEARRRGDHLVGDAGEHLDGAGMRAAGIDQRRPLGDDAGAFDLEYARSR